jgi:peptide subunit release factor 1 (eRF1)
MKKNTIICAGFTGVGKTHLIKSNPNLSCMESESSNFTDNRGTNMRLISEEKSEWPLNYLKHIKNNIGKYDIIFVSTHKELREALEENNLDYILIYPSIELKEEYLERYKNRHSSDDYVKLINKNWDTWVNQLNNENCKKIMLNSNEYLSDVIDKIFELSEK